MVDPISNAPSSRQIGPVQRRSRASSGSNAQFARDSVQRVEALQAAVEKLIKKNLPKHPRFPSLSDEKGGAGSSDAEDVGDGGGAQWPPRQLLRLRHYLKQMEGLLLDPEA